MSSILWSRHFLLVKVGDFAAGSYYIFLTNFVGIICSSLYLMVIRKLKPPTRSVNNGKMLSQVISPTAALKLAIVPDGNCELFFI